MKVHMAERLLFYRLSFPFVEEAFYKKEDNCGDAERSRGLLESSKVRLDVGPALLKAHAL